MSRLMEFAVIHTGGKQYAVKAGDTLRVEKLSDEHKEGDKIVFDKVLLTDNGKDMTVGTPYVAGAKVSATLTSIGRAKKVIVVKYKQKSRYYKKRGHRQPYFEVTIESVK